MSGNAPKRSGLLVGYQLVPVRKSHTLTTLKMGSPSLKRKIIMSNNINRQVNPMTKNIRLKTMSKIMLL
jgi:hypothetical protein